MYQWQNQYALPFGNWIHSASSSTVPGIVVKLCITINALDGRSIVGSMCDSKKCRFGRQFWWACRQQLPATMELVPEGTTTSTLCSIERRTSWPKTFLSTLIWLILFCELVNFFLTSQAAKVFSLLRLIGLWKPTDFSTKRELMKSSIAFLPMSWASSRSLAMSGLAGTPEDKQYSSLSSTLELKGLVKPEIASSTRFTSCSLLCIWAGRKSLWLDISSELISVRWRVEEYWALMWRVMPIMPPCDLAWRFIVCSIVMSTSFLEQETDDRDTLNPFCSRSSLHPGCVSDKFGNVIRYTGTYRA